MATVSYDALVGRRAITGLIATCDHNEADLEEFVDGSATQHD